MNSITDVRSEQVTISFHFWCVFVDNHPKRYLGLHPETHTVHLHLDNDEIGRGAAEGIKKSLEGRYTVLNEPPSCGKDVNDQLMMRLGLKRTKEEHER